MDRSFMLNDIIGGKAKLCLRPTRTVDKSAPVLQAAGETLKNFGAKLSRPPLAPPPPPLSLNNVKLTKSVVTARTTTAPKLGDVDRSALMQQIKNANFKLKHVGFNDVQPKAANLDIVKDNYQPNTVLETHDLSPPDESAMKKVDVGGSFSSDHSKQQNAEEMCKPSFASSFELSVRSKSVHQARQTIMRMCQGASLISTCCPPPAGRLDGLRQDEGGGGDVFTAKPIFVKIGAALGSPDSGRSGGTSPAMSLASVSTCSTSSQSSYSTWKVSKDSIVQTARQNVVAKSLQEICGKKMAAKRATLIEHDQKPNNARVTNSCDLEQLKNFQFQIDLFGGGAASDILRLEKRIPM